MAITASKPAINIREKLSELDQPQGIKGTEVLRADTADEVRNAIGARGRKNLIINGGFDVWQRGTSFTPPGYSYTADRWIFVQGNVNISKQSDTVYGNFCRVSGTSATPVYLTQRVEGVKLLQAKTMTVSFYAKSSTNISLNQKVRIVHTGGNYDRNTIASFSLTTSWQKFSYTFDVNGSSYSYDDSSHLDIQTISNVNINGIDIDIAQVQLELGDQATEFEHRSYGEELALCQRYYYRIDGTTYVWITPCQRHGSGMRSVISLPVALRSAPSIYYDNIGYWYNNGGLNNGAYNFSLHYISASATNITQLNLYFDPSYHYLGSNANLTAMLSIESGVSTGYLAFDAEL
jgi:hypothetical protein